MTSKQVTAPVVISAEIRELSRQIEQWRSTRAHRMPMPEPLWMLAANLAAQYGVAQVPSVPATARLEPEIKATVTSEAAPKELEPEIPPAADLFANKVTGLSYTKKWRDSAVPGSEIIFEALAVLESKNRYDKNAVRIDVACYDGYEKLGYLTSGVAATFRAACARVDPDTELGRAIAKQSIPCKARVYLGDIYAACETDHYSYAHTDVVRRVKDIVKEQEKLKRKAERKLKRQAAPAREREAL